jgi:hypothetical protein
MVSHCLALYSTRRHLSISKGADRLTSPYRLKNIDLEWGICAAKHSLVEAEWGICAAELRLGHGTGRGGVGGSTAGGEERRHEVCPCRRCGGNGGCGSRYSLDD